MTKIELIKGLAVVLFLGALGTVSILLFGLEPRGFSSPLIVFAISTIAVPVTAFVPKVSRTTLLRVVAIYVVADLSVIVALLWEYSYGPNNYYIPRYWSDLFPMLILWLLLWAGWQLWSVGRWVQRGA